MDKDLISSISHLKSDRSKVDLFQSERFRVQVLRPMENNYSNYLAWMRDKKSNPFIMGIDPNMSLDHLNDYVSRKFLSPTSLLLGIFSISDKKHVGNIKFELIQDQESSLEIGILIGDSEWRNRGVATEILSQSIYHISRELKIKKFELGVHSDNAAAIRVYKKIGFRLLEQSEILDNLRMRLEC